MWSDIADLKAFYDSGTGLVARRLIRRRLRAMWPDTASQTVMGFGFATPYLRLFHGDADRLIALMPGPQGVMHWPAGEPNCVTACDETDLPLPDKSIDRALLIHAVESSEALRRMLHEVWRVLSDGGKMIAVVPSRRAIWARIERTPFGHGRPYTEGQIRRLLKDLRFTPTRVENALFMPPFRSRWLLSTAPAWERIGARGLSFFAGVMLVEAEKQVAGAIVDQVRAPVRVLPAPGLAGARARTRLQDTA